MSTNKTNTESNNTLRADYAKALQGMKGATDVENISHALAAGIQPNEDVIYSRLETMADTMDAIAALLAADREDGPAIDPQRIARILYECAGATRVSLALLKAPTHRAAGAAE
jgi:hypothetical protein